MPSFNYPNARYTSNLGFALFGQDEVLAENWLIADQAYGSGGSISVNGTLVTAPNLSSTLPLAPLGEQLVTFQFDANGNISAYIPIPAAGGVTSLTGDSVVYNNALSAGAVTLSLIAQTANTVFAGPSAGIAATPTFRALVAADIPSLSGTYLPLAGGTLTGNLLFSLDNAHTIGAVGATRPSIIYAGTSVIAPLFNAATGFQIAGAAPSGHFLVGNGTNYVDATALPSGTVTWDQIGNAAAALILANANYATTFNQTSAVAWTWANTTAATSAGTVATIALVASGVTTLLNQATNSVTLNTTGATLLVVLANSYNGYATITDSFGNTWTKASTSGETPGLSATAVYYAYSSLSGGALIVGANHTINVTSSNYNGGSVYAFSGTNTTSAVLGTATAAGATNLASPIASCSITPVTGDLLINGFGVNQTATAPTFSANGDGNTWSSPLGNGSAAVIQAFWAAYTVAASTTASNPKWTRAGVTAANQVMVSFKPAVVSVPQSSPILTLAGTYYGSGSAADSWTIQDVVSATVNGPSTLTLLFLAHSLFLLVFR